MEWGKINNPGFQIAPLKYYAKPFFLYSSNPPLASINEERELERRAEKQAARQPHLIQPINQRINKRIH